MRLQKFISILAAVILVFCIAVPAFATELAPDDGDNLFNDLLGPEEDGEERQPGDKEDPVWDRDGEGEGEETTEPAVTTDEEGNIVDEEGNPVTDEEGNPVKATEPVETDEEGNPIEPEDTDKPEETTSEETEEPIDPVDFAFTPDKKDAEVAVLVLTKGDEGWEISEQDYYEDEDDLPETIEIKAELADNHGNISVERTKGGWKVTSADYYGSKLQVVPVIIITFLITLAIVVAVNLLIIKIYRR